jgi:hypothetical protein
VGSGKNMFEDEQIFDSLYHKNREKNGEKSKIDRANMKRIIATNIILYDAELS